jgi:hypothetical protein
VRTTLRVNYYTKVWDLSKPQETQRMGSGLVDEAAEKIKSRGGTIANDPNK